MKRNRLGKKSEKLAQKYLERKKYKTLTTNFRSPVGEIDIIAQKGDVLVLVEVKSRSSERFGLAEEAVDQRKIGKIIKTGEYFKQLRPKMPEAMRIDLVTVNFFPDGKLKKIELFENITG